MEEVVQIFLGTYTPKLDEKGRFFLPAKFREEFADGLVITRQHEHCLAMYPKAVFEMKAMQAIAAPATQSARGFQRMLAAGATDDLPDRQGRVTVPPLLRRYAGLTRDIVVIGAIDRLEIWDAEAWEEYSTTQEDVFAGMDEDVRSFG